MSKIADFNADIREKKSIASGAKHRKVGSKSKKCSLPSDNITAKEIKALNGELHTLNFDSVYTIEELSVFTKSTQKKYLEYLAAHVCNSFEEFCQFFKLTETRMKDYMFSVNFKYNLKSEPKVKSVADSDKRLPRKYLPKFDTVTVDGVEIPFNITKLEHTLENDTVENRQIFCAMLKLLYVCRVSVSCIFRCLRTSHSRLLDYVECGFDMYHIDRDQYDTLKQSSYLRGNFMLKDTYDTKEEKKTIGQYVSKPESKLRYQLRVNLVDAICDMVLNPATKTKQLPVSNNLATQAIVSGNLHMEGTASDVIRQISAILNPDASIKIDVKF